MLLMRRVMVTLLRLLSLTCLLDISFLSRLLHSISSRRASGFLLPSLAFQTDYFFYQSSLLWLTPIPSSCLYSNVTSSERPSLAPRKGYVLMVPVVMNCCCITNHS